MTTKAYITGMGIASALGIGVEANIESIMSHKSGIRPLRWVDSRHRGHLPAGEVSYSTADLCGLLDIQNTKYYSRTSLLGIIAAREAVKHNEFPKQASRLGLISSTTVGGIDRSEVAFRAYLQKEKLNGAVHKMISHDCGDSTERIADDLGVRGFITTISTACSSSANAILLGARMIESGMLDQVIVGGTDALTLYTINGFNILKILDHQHCRPFDAHRAGLNLGEAAAYLVLSSEQHMMKSGIQPLAILAGAGNANDAYHQTASSPEGHGALRAMKQALHRANLSVDQIDYVNAHGTATPNNDLSESLALLNFFNGSVPLFNSTKSYTGHTLAAAGSVEAILSIGMMQAGKICPSLNFETPMTEVDLTPVKQLTELDRFDHVLSNSFGFGGNCSTLIFSKV